MPDLRTSDFDYHLPPELIAQDAAGGRAPQSRLLVVSRVDGPPGGRAVLQDRHFSGSSDSAPPGDLLVLNTTRVRHARLLGTRPSGAPAEVLLIHPGPTGTWRRHGKAGQRAPARQADRARREGVASKPWRCCRTATAWSGSSAPPPPRRWRGSAGCRCRPTSTGPPTPRTTTRYQTVYAEREGSVAAPTAGLHFTPELLRRAGAAGCGIAPARPRGGPRHLQAGGDGGPRRASDASPSATRFRRSGARAVIAAGRRRGQGLGGGHHRGAGAGERRVRGRPCRPAAAETRLLITPGYRFRVVDRLLTNFHLPRSTLLMLVAHSPGTR